MSPTKGPLAVPADPTAAPDHQASTASNNRVVNQPHLNPVRNMYVVILIYIRHMTTFYIIIFLERLLFYCLTLIIIMIRGGEGGGVGRVRVSPPHIRVLYVNAQMYSKRTALLSLGPIKTDFDRHLAINRAGTPKSRPEASLKPPLRTGPIRRHDLQRQGPPRRRAERGRGRRPAGLAPPDALPAAQPGHQAHPGRFPGPVSLPASSGASR